MSVKSPSSGPIPAKTGQEAITDGALNYRDGSSAKPASGGFDSAFRQVSPLAAAPKIELQAASFLSSETT
jgi:hypothetical protein